MLQGSNSKSSKCIDWLIVTEKYIIWFAYQDTITAFKTKPSQVRNGCVNIIYIQLNILETGKLWDSFI